VRFILMVVIPLLALAAGTAVYLNGGRFVSTDNAYIKTDIATVSPEVAGAVTAVMVSENQKVTKGQALVTIDDSNYRIMLAASEAQLRAAVSSIESAKARYRRTRESMGLMQTNVGFAEREFARKSALATKSFVAASKLDEAKQALDTARKNIGILRQEQAEVLAMLDGNPDANPEDLPSYQQAVAARASAMRQIERATVTAPFAGVVSQLPKVGDFARAGAPILSLVSTAAVWVEANFKETDLTQMQVGQPVDVKVDTYPGRVFKGQIESISQATGAEFAVLPAQNSTGNWIKVVQRIPVRIKLEPEAGAPTLRSGMSVTAEVDTGVRRADTLFGGR
jgi:membrane fusion protein (multidrug efflux system)